MSDNDKQSKCCTCDDLTDLQRYYGEHYDDCPLSDYMPTDTPETSQMEPCEEFKCESGWLPINGVHEGVFLLDDAEEYRYLPLLIPTSFTACPCNPWYSLNLDLISVGDYYAGYRTSGGQQRPRGWRDERNEVLAYLRQFDCEEDWNLARGLVADIEAGKHLQRKASQPYSETAAIIELGKRDYEKSRGTE